ncbi:hypothetical protein MBLNU459_g2030t3 [Dothideomycetes sp. NU459]
MRRDWGSTRVIRDTGARHLGVKHDYMETSSVVERPAAQLEDVQLAPSHAPEDSRPAMTCASPTDVKDKDVKITSPRSRVSRNFRNKAPEPSIAVQAVKKPLHLLDLPVDILKDIVKEVTHTNDLTSLALCHSALHNLVIPHIYSRFDIVWPDSTNPTEPRTGVDALTYGLATLVMAEDVFGEAAWQIKLQSQQQTAGKLPTTISPASVKQRRGNYYALFTRKFSIGNGPPEWVQEYRITKEGGKMLGTLAALALARMRNLETFIWDMPTGILCDVWTALSSLGDRNDNDPCRLERVSIRCHDNAADRPHAPSPAPQPLRNLPSPLSALKHVEQPSFSILPPLKSLSVLDIDELQYLDELSVLIGRSQSSLRELRIGIVRHLDRDWATVWDGEHVQQIDKAHTTAGCITIGEKRLGGILGILTGWVSDLHRTYALPHRPKRLRRRSNVAVADLQDPLPATTAIESETAVLAASSHTVADSASNVIESGTGGDLAAEPSLVSLEQESTQADQLAVPALDANDTIPIEKSLSETEDSSQDVILADMQGTSSIPDNENTRRTLLESKLLQPGNGAADLPLNPDEEESRLAGKLCLSTLELERVPLSIPVLQNVFDWGTLTSLTLLQCPNHEHLWKALRRSYSPSALTARQYCLSNPSRTVPESSPNQPSYPHGYKLNLRRIHTDMVSSCLISFIKDALAPNSLEVIFLQKARGHSTTVSIDAIFRGVLKKHRTSLRKVLIDSSEKGPDGHLLSNSSYKHWMLNHDVLKFITCGKMPALRELGAALNYQDWHFFLQNIPSVPHLRSLYVPYLANYVHGDFAEPRELALQIVDIIALRPEVELCYLGIGRKCFEIIESHKGNDGHDDSLLVPTDDEVGSDEDAEDDDDDDHDDSDADSDEDDQSEDTDSDESRSEHGYTDSEDGHSSMGRKLPRLRLREILYYDDKVTIFKARHGKL